MGVHHERTCAAVADHERRPDLRDRQLLRHRPCGVPGADAAQHGWLDRSVLGRAVGPSFFRGHPHASRQNGSVHPRFSDGGSRCYRVHGGSTANDVQSGRRGVLLLDRPAVPSHHDHGLRGRPRRLHAGQSGHRSARAWKLPSRGASRPGRHGRSLEGAASSARASGRYQADSNIEIGRRTRVSTKRSADSSAKRR